MTACPGRMAVIELAGATGTATYHTLVFGPPTWLKARRELQIGGVRVRLTTTDASTVATPGAITRSLLGRSAMVAIAAGAAVTEGC